MLSEVPKVHPARKLSVKADNLFKKFQLKVSGQMDPEVDSLDSESPRNEQSLIVVNSAE